MKILTKYCIVGALLGILMALLLTWPHVETSDLYKKYESRQDMNVDYVKGYYIDDSTEVNITIITAKDSAAWVSLLEDFALNDYFIQSYFESIREGAQIVMQLPRERNNPQKQVVPQEVPAYDLGIYTSDDMSLYVFHVESGKQANAIATKKIKETFHKKINL